MTQKTHDITSALNEFRSELNVPERDRSALLSARSRTRKHLEEQFLPALRLVAKSANLAAMPQGAEIKFLTQGSYVYRTLNHPAHIPPQQMDLDDGIYFRASDVHMLSPGMLLDVMEGILGEWAKRNGWEPVSKPNCCRVVLPDANGGVANKHIDWPIYVAHDDEMDNLEKHDQHRTRYFSVYEEWEFPYITSMGKVRLAHREEGWVSSDPRKVIDWVADQQKKHGATFANVCRYVKAWRDHQWRNSPLTSITIMVIVANAFDENGGKEDDLLLHAARYVGACLQSGVYAPFDGDSSEQLDGGITDEDRVDICDRANALYEALRQALYGGLSRSEVCVLMRKHFGDRWPAPPPTVKPTPPPPIISVSPKKQWCN